MTQNISSLTKLKLAQCLAEIWKEFAEEIPLPKYKIASIEQEQKLLVERAHRVLTFWYQSDPDAFNENNIKMKLKSLKRNDIIRAVFGEEDDQPAKPKETNVSKVEDLSYRQIRVLSDFLDPDYGWEEFAHHLFEHDNEMINEIQKLRHEYAGGGNPAYLFLKQLLQRRPNILLNEFLDACKEVKRADIIHYANENFSGISYISELDKNQLRDFADKVRGNIVPSNWAEIASEFGEFSSEDIKRIELERLAPNSYSPTKKLFEKLKQIHPNMELDNLINVCEKIRRKDVANKLREFAINNSSIAQ
ncbi:DODE isoform X2 [Hydra vulgaris]|uniref:DODE n=2 Tax=Hydra vulgaris TaxID=6087 RepID=F2XX01_HYDVU|nr:DODE [Hydra vulgaris]ADU79235.1 DODE [Hydra vulgaris]